MRSTWPTPAIEVEVGLRPDSSSRAAAEEAGLPVKDVPDAVEGAQVVAMLVPDGPQAALFRDEVAPNLSPGAALLFAHGFAVHYGRIDAAGGARRDHGRAEGPRPHRPPACSRRATARPR